MLTEIAQLVVTLVVLMGGGWALTHAQSLGLDADTIGMIKTLVTGWSGFWLGAKVQRQLAPPDVKITRLSDSSPSVTEVTNSQRLQ